MNTGIYQIRNLINSKLYIGSAAGRGGLQERWLSHQYLVNSGGVYSG